MIRIYILTKPNAAKLITRMMYHNGRFRCEPTEEGDNITSLIRVTLLSPLPIDCAGLLNDVTVVQQIAKDK